MITTRVEIQEHVEGGCLVTISVWEWQPGRRHPRIVHKPWEHYLSMPEGVTQEEVFRTLRRALRELKMDEPTGPTAEGGSAPLEGPRGGVTQ